MARSQDEQAVRRSEFCAWGEGGDAVPPQKARRERARKRLLRTSALVREVRSLLFKSVLRSNTQADS